MSEIIYGKNGRRLVSRITCPKCRHPISRVIMSHQDEHGVVARKRKCQECGLVFFTGQEPEYLVKETGIKWSGGRPFIKSDSES